MLTGAVKRLRSTNQLKEGMEQIIMEQCKTDMCTIPKGMQTRV